MGKNTEGQLLITGNIINVTLWKNYIGNKLGISPKWFLIKNFEMITEWSDSVFLWNLSNPSLQVQHKFTIGDIKLKMNNGKRSFFF